MKLSVEWKLVDNNNQGNVTGAPAVMLHYLQHFKPQQLLKLYSGYRKHFLSLILLSRLALTSLTKTHFWLCSLGHLMQNYQASGIP